MNGLFVVKNKFYIVCFKATNNSSNLLNSHAINECFLTEINVYYFLFCSLKIVLNGEVNKYYDLCLKFYFKLKHQILLLIVDIIFVQVATVLDLYPKINLFYIDSSMGFSIKKIGSYSS